MNTKKQVLIGAIVLALVVSGGSFAISYTNATTAMDVGVAGAEVALIEPAEEGDQPDWDSLTSLQQETVDLRPAAKGDKTDIDIQYPDETQHWDKVDEVTFDGDGTYVASSSASWKQDSYLIAGTYQDWGTIDYIRVYAQLRATDTPTRTSAVIGIKTGGTEYGGGDKTVTEVWMPYSSTWNTNPDTSTAWTWEDIGALQIGIGLRRPRTAGVEETRCSQLWVEVGYRAMVVSGEVPTGELFTVTTHENYTGDLKLKVYLANTGNLTKAYSYLNVKLYLEDSEEAGQTPDYQLLTIENGVVTFHLKNVVPGPHILSVTGGSFTLVSGDTTQWQEGWAVEPELYCEIY